MKLAKILSIVSVVATISFLSGCGGPRMAKPEQLTAPEPIADNSGKYMSPYTSDGVVAEWVDKGINAKAGAAVGSAAGAYAGRKMMENVPFLGGFLGQKVGNAAGRAIALKAAGGEEFIRESSDLSFNSIDDLSVYLYVNYSTNENFADVLSATQEIYPEMKQRYYQAIVRASRAAR